jgi:long-chain acyl-CoA synthetase
MSDATSSRMFNRIRVVFDRDVTAANAIDRAVAAHPDSPLFHLDAPLPYKSLSGPVIRPRQLLSFVNRVGNVLCDCGMKRYDRVAIYKTNGPDYFFLALAIIKAGGIAVPINAGMQSEQLRRYLDYCGASILVTDSDVFNERLHNPACFPGVKTWIFPNAPAEFATSYVDLNQSIEIASETLEPVRLDADSEILIVHTSGTTGPPKGVVCTSGSIVSGLKGHYKGEPIRARNRTAVAGHFNHLVYFVGFFSSLLGNLPVWTISRLDAVHVLELIDCERINIFFAFPDLYLRIYDLGLDNYSLSSVRIWIATADTSHEAHMKAFCQKGAFLRLFGRPVIRSIFIEALGSSEVGFAALMRPFFSFTKPRLKRMVGRGTIAGPKVRITDDEGRTLAPGKTGRLAVKGPTLFKGYWNSNEMLHGVVHDGWWWTGDVAYRDRLGRFYHLDRFNDVVQTKHGPVYTLLVEEALLTYPGVIEAVVFGVPTSEGDQVPLGVITIRRGHSVDPESCRRWINDRLQLPAPLSDIVVVKLSEIPRGLTGKVLKRVMRESYGSWFTAREAAAASELPGTKEPDSET